MKKAVAILGTWALAVGILVANGSSPSRAAVTSGPFSAFATGTAEHVSGIDAPPTRVIDAEAAFSRAGTNSQGLFPISNEVQEGIVPPDLESANKLPTSPFHSYGGGSGVELGLGTTIAPPNNPDLNQVILGGLAEQVADPPTPASDVTNDPATNGFVTKDLANINQANPLLYANLLRGQGKANWSDNNGFADPCDAAQPLAFGLGHAADVQLLNTGNISLPLPGSTPLIATDKTPVPPGNNPGAADESRSFTSLIPDPANPGHFIVHTETRQVLAPVTLFKGTSNELTIQIGGEWVLKTDASGNALGAHVSYGVEGISNPNTVVLDVIQGGKSLGSLTVQQIAGPTGLNITIPPGPFMPPVVLEVSAGQDAHKIGDVNAKKVESADGQDASGAVDVARVRVLSALPQFQLADIRVGHMEGSSHAPAGGVTCSKPAAATTTTTAASGTTTTTAAGATTTTTATGATTTTTAGGTTTTTSGGGVTPGQATTTTTAASNGTTTTTAAANNNANNATTTTTAPAQVLATTFSQSPTAQPQTQQPNFTG